MGRDASRRRPYRALTVPFDRQGPGWEAAYAALFLISSESSYVNARTAFSSVPAIWRDRARLVCVNRMARALRYQPQCPTLLHPQTFWKSKT
jgi:hypothetical protein